MAPGRHAPVHPSLLVRKIIHLDMDAFFAAVEVRDNPSLRGLPVVVGGSPDGRGVVATASYEARVFGVRSAMPAARARRLCPQAVFLRPRMDVYAAEARRIREVMHHYTDLVEPLSVDEAYLDVTGHPTGLSATEIARRLKQEVREATGGLTASCGVGPNKLVAKIASDLQKPDGLVVVRPADVAAFVGGLEIARIPGVGKVTRERLLRIGVERCADAQAIAPEDLIRAIGQAAGLSLYQRVRGIDERAVEADRSPKSIGHEETFEVDVTYAGALRAYLDDAAERVAARLAARRMHAHGVTVKVRYDDFATITRSIMLERWTRDASALAETGKALLDRTEAGRRPVRLLGLTATHLHEPATRLDSGQLLLFEV